MPLKIVFLHWTRCCVTVLLASVYMLTRAKGHASLYFLAENYIVVPAYAYDIEKQTLVGQFRFYRGITPSFILRIRANFFANVNIQNHKSHAFSIQNRILSKCWLKRV